ncbi:hypothetical protein CVV26_01505 [Candidatus Kuenenbacteria bacterium HGW-Kuenenbacteria-1]|uniref:Uncharacterized protein n=1 Tax=Candidatus Kuenenbacteria bacterium HGW-Kuenenbacteria-1 TaxID=2013812 RepID=A0A2N1UNL2_9BACT|nr:MAG: hypothetical protein CVV26_01505 [Candidatus Kuenenbacteria bacterium HGW-Kuenenbacteria-1]
MGKKSPKKNLDIQFYISRILIILIIFFAIFFKTEIINWIIEKKIPIKENNETLENQNKNIKNQNIEIESQEKKKKINLILKSPYPMAIKDGPLRKVEPRGNSVVKTPVNIEIQKPEKPKILEMPKISQPEISKYGNLSRGSFTDLFSGTGWKNSQTSTVYQDFKTTTISFSPAYQWEEIYKSAPLNFTKENQIIKSNRKEAVCVIKQGEIIAFQNEKQPLFYTIEEIKKAKVDNVPLLDYDKYSKKWIAVFVVDKKLFVYSFTVEKGEIILAHSFANSFIDSEVDLNLACVKGKCLITNGKKLWKFDTQTLKISLIEFKISQSSLLSIGKTDDLWLLGVVEKDEKKYKGNIYQFTNNHWQIIFRNQNSFFSSEYFGNIFFGYNPNKQEILAVYGAYEGQAYQFSINNQSFIQNFSQFFPIRVMDGEMKPEIFYQDGAWWIGSSSKSSSPKFLRLLSGIGNDFTPVLLENVLSFQLVPGFKEHQIYGIAFDNAFFYIYRFTDLGFQKKDKVIWESLKINSKNNKIMQGSLVEKEDGEEEGKIQYFLTNNGGKNWTKAELGKMIKFKTIGSDFRWKVEFLPSIDSFSSPWATRVMVDYYQVRD